MSEAPPRHRSRIIAIALVLILIGAVPGAYLVFYSSQPKKAPSHGLAVESNRIVLVKLPNFNYSEGVWRMQLSNTGITTDNAEYLIRVNGNIAYGNSSTLQPGQRSNITVCLQLPFVKPIRFEVATASSNSSGMFFANYPVTIQNATQTQYTGQFSITNKLSASVYNSELNRNLSSWSITVSNVGTRPIEFAYAELWNNAMTPLAVFQVLCAGESYLNNCGQPLAPGQSASGTRPLSFPGSTVVAGKTYKVDVVAVYSDFSEVFQSYVVQATG